MEEIQRHHRRQDAQGKFAESDGHIWKERCLKNDEDDDDDDDEDDDDEDDDDEDDDGEGGYWKWVQVWELAA